MKSLPSGSSLTETHARVLEPHAVTLSASVVSLRGGMGYFEEASVADFNLDGVGVVAFDGEEVKAVYGVLVVLEVVDVPVDVCVDAGGDFYDCGGESGGGKHCVQPFGLGKQCL